MRFGVQHLGDSAVLVTLGDHADEVALARVRGVTAALEKDPPAHMVESVPGYRTVAIHYDPLSISYEAFKDLVVEKVSGVSGASAPPARTIEIPVCYGGDFGPDLTAVAQHNDIEEKAVVSLHTKQEYRVRMIGFAPGFAYLDGMSERLATPRLEQPRRSVPAGSVGIAGGQTGVYPLDTPGGWRLIGRTPLRLFDPALEEPSLLRTGDVVRFVAIDQATFNSRNGGAS